MAPEPAPIQAEELPYAADAARSASVAAVLLSIPEVIRETPPDASSGFAAAALSPVPVAEAEPESEPEPVPEPAPAPEPLREPENRSFNRSLHLSREQCWSRNRISTRSRRSKLKPDPEPEPDPNRSRHRPDQPEPPGPAGRGRGYATAGGRLRQEGDSDY